MVRPPSGIFASQSELHIENAPFASDRKTDFRTKRLICVSLDFRAAGFSNSTDNDLGKTPSISDSIFKRIFVSSSTTHRRPTSSLSTKNEFCLTSKVSHGGRWREVCVSTTRDSYRSWLNRLVRLRFHFSRISYGIRLRSIPRTPRAPSAHRSFASRSCSFAPNGRALAFACGHKPVAVRRCRAPKFNFPPIRTGSSLKKWRRSNIRLFNA